MTSATSIASVLFMITAIAIVFLIINKDEHDVENSSRVQTPMIGMSHHQGPWPVCLDTEGEACCQMVQAYAKEITCEIYQDADELTDDFDPNRVRIHLDENGYVDKIPDRG